MARIELTDSIMDMIIKMAEGNLGALNALMEIMAKHDEIDPQGAMGGVGSILILDTWEIYGTCIYVLFNDQCDRDVRKMLMLMRACQLGMFPESRLKAMAHDQCRTDVLSDAEWIEIDSNVCERLDQFQKVA